MISYIIPTLWKSDSIYDTINQFMRLKDDKAELIIIDNTNSSNHFPDKRIKVCKMEENQYVNPSWNIGVDLSNNNQVAIINDDIVFNVNKFHQFVLDKKPKALCMVNSNKLGELEHYSLELTNNLLLVTMILLLISYCLYSFLSIHPNLIYTLPIALYVIFRYFYLTTKGSVITRHPEKIYKDWRITFGIVLWVLVTFLIIYL